MSEFIRAEDIEVSFGERAILSGVDLAVEPGEAVAVVGANGAGKTTFMKVLAGVLEPDGGRVELRDGRIDEMTRREIARRLAVVSQGTPQVFDYGVLEFALMGNHARTRGFVATDDEIEEARRALRSVELEGLADHPVSKLSGGELQRALMARAIVASVGLWLLDEPTASLDVRHQVTLLNRMREHVADEGAAVAVLHDLALVHRFFDRVVVLVDGEFRADGAPDEVLTEQLVSRTYDAAMQRGRIDGREVWVVTED